VSTVIRRIVAQIGKMKRAGGFPYRPVDVLLSFTASSVLARRNLAGRLHAVCTVTHIAARATPT